MNRRETVRRGQVLYVWSVLNGANYRYIMLYGFRDDGQVSIRLGATAHNLNASNEDSATHLHTGCWRINVELGNQEFNRMQLVRYLSSAAMPNPVTDVQDFQGGKEGEATWRPDEFTMLRVQSTVVVNSHDPANRIAYDLLPMRSGSARLYGVGEEFTRSDFWVTKAHDDVAELRYRDLPSYVNGENWDPGAAVIWHQAPIMHSPRDEDFGPTGYNPDEGVALTAWAGFDLKPRNLFAKSPLYP